MYWVGKRKLGVISTGPRGLWDGSYRWTCTAANLKGASHRLALAKSLVEAVIHAGVYQFDLFSGDEEHDPAGPVAAASLVVAKATLNAPGTSSTVN